MKKRQIVIVLILFSNINIIAQNWQPICKDNMYNYQIDTIDYINNTIKVDSVNVIEGDSVFYLNRIMTSCDTCANNSNNHYALKNQPQFLMRKMVKKSDSLFLFQDTCEFRIMPLLHFGQSWVYDEENNINAVISYEGEGNVLNITDSIKQINLSNGKSLTISKNYGIIKFSYNSSTFYNLVGIEKNNIKIGENLPNFWDCFNWEVGDVFQRKTYSESWGDFYLGRFFIKKYTITSKQITGDTITYETEGWKKDISIMDDPMLYDTTASEYTETLRFIDSTDHFANKTNHELADINQYHDLQFWDSPYLDKVHLKYEQSRYIKQCGTMEDLYYPFYQVSNDNPDLLEGAYGPEMVLYRCTEGLGLDFEMMFFEIARGDIFMGKIHNGDTIGTVYPDSHFEQYAVSVENLNSENIFIYPNPISRGQTLKIRTEAEIKSYNIFNIAGINVLSRNYYGEINVNCLSSGIYILELITNNGIIRQKIIVK